MTGPYDDIMFLPRPVSERHPPMKAENRAAQFAPFAALTGFERILDEARQRSEIRRLPEPDDAEEIDRRLKELLSRQKERPRVKLTWYEANVLEDSGRYLTETVQIRRVLAAERCLELTDYRLISMEDLWKIEEPED